MLESNVGRASDLKSEITKICQSQFLLSKLTRMRTRGTGHLSHSLDANFRKDLMAQMSLYIGINTPAFKKSTQHANFHCFFRPGLSPTQSKVKTS